MNQVAIKVFNQKKIIGQPLFPSYVFVHVAESNLEYVKKVTGVIGLVHWLDEPATFPDAEIELMREFMSQHVLVQLKRTLVNKNEVAKVVNSNFTQHDNGIIAGNDKQMKLILPSLGCILSVGTEPVSNTVYVEDFIHQTEISDSLVVSR